MIKDRIKEANKTQAVLSKHGNIIKSRLGFHEVSESTCSRVGVMLLQLAGNNEDRQSFLKDLSAIEGIEIQQIKFEY
jgi:glycine cleavage system regulatory protein